MDKIFRDHADKLSMMRMLVCWIVVLYSGVWGWLSIKQGEMLYVDTDQLLMILGALGAKVFQAGVENKKSENKLE